MRLQLWVCQAGPNFRLRRPRGHGTGQQVEPRPTLGPAWSSMVQHIQFSLIWESYIVKWATWAEGDGKIMESMAKSPVESSMIVWKLHRGRLCCLCASNLHQLAISCHSFAALRKLLKYSCLKLVRMIPVVTNPCPGGNFENRK